jgi:hypothetical protein
MLQENEVISCILTVGVVLFVLVNYRAVTRLPCSAVLLWSLLFFLLSNVFTVCEDLWLEQLFNVLEHLCYTITLILLALWCGLAYRQKDSGDA